MSAAPNSPVLDLTARPPLYVFTFTIQGYEISFYLCNNGWNSEAAEPAAPALGQSSSITDASGLISTMVSYLYANGWNGQTVSDVHVTMYHESGMDVTP